MPARDQGGAGHQARSGDQGVHRDQTRKAGQSQERGISSDTGVSAKGRSSVPGRPISPHAAVLTGVVFPIMVAMRLTVSGKVRDKIAADGQAGGSSPTTWRVDLTVLSDLEVPRRVTLQQLNPVVPNPRRCSWYYRTEPAGARPNWRLARKFSQPRCG